jgi:hypothetical protein
MSKSKHTWTKEENTIVSSCYLDGMKIQDVYQFAPNIKPKSIKMKYSNCLFLDKGQVHSALKNCSKMHKEVFYNLLAERNQLNLTKAVDPNALNTQNEEEEEDGETYFKCTGICERVFHYEDSDEDGMCGTCYYKINKSNR